VNNITYVYFYLLICFFFSLLLSLLRMLYAFFPFFVTIGYMNVIFIDYFQMIMLTSSIECLSSKIRVHICTNKQSEANRLKSGFSLFTWDTLLFFEVLELIRLAKKEIKIQGLLALITKIFLIIRCRCNNIQLSNIIIDLFLT